MDGTSIYPSCAQFLTLYRYSIHSKLQLSTQAESMCYLMGLLLKNCQGALSDTSPRIRTGKSALEVDVKVHALEIVERWTSCITRGTHGRAAAPPSTPLSTLPTLIKKFKALTGGATRS